MYKNRLNLNLFCGKLEIFEENFLKYNYPVENIIEFSTSFPQIFIFPSVTNEEITESFPQFPQFLKQMSPTIV
jgi:hypothetical protein